MQQLVHVVQMTKLTRQQYCLRISVLYFPHVTLYSCFISSCCSYTFLTLLLLLTHVYKSFTSFVSVQKLSFLPSMTKSNKEKSQSVTCCLWLSLCLGCCAQELGLITTNTHTYLHIATSRAQHTTHTDSSTQHQLQ